MGFSLQAECLYSVKLFKQFFLYTKKNLIKGGLSGFLSINMQVKIKGFSICAAGQTKLVFFNFHMFSQGLSRVVNRWYIGFFGCTQMELMLAL